MALLKTSCADDSYAALSARWQSRKGERAERWKALLADLLRAEQAVRRALGDRQEQVEFFFRPLRDGGGMTRASFLYEGRPEAGLFSGMEEIRRALLARTEAERAQAFLEVLQGNEYEDGAGGVERLFRELVDCDLTDAQKQTVGQLFFRYEAYVEQMFSLVETAIEAMRPWRPMFEEQVEACAQRWETILAREDLLSWLNDRYQMALEENPHGCVIVPGVAGCNSMTVHVREEKETPGRPYGIWMGVLVDGTNSDAEPDLPALCDALKLLSDRSKMDILRILREQRAYGGELARRLNLTTATISYHMQALISCNLVGVEKVGNRLYYTLNRRRVEELLSELHAGLLD